MMLNPRKEIFNQLAEDWDSNKQWTKEQLETINRVIKGSKIKKDDSILDVGCGTGVLIPFFLKYIGNAGRITAVDVSDKMIDVAKGKYNDNRITFVADDIYNYKFNDNTFNKIFVFSAFPHLHNKVKALDIFHKWLKMEGGLIIFHVESSEEINHFHSNKIKNPVLQNDYLPDIHEMKEIINVNKWEIDLSENKKGLYLLRLLKK